VLNGVPTRVPFANVLQDRNRNPANKLALVWSKAGVFLTESYYRNIGLKIWKLPRKSGELAALCNVELVAVEQTAFISTRTHH